MNVYLDSSALVKLAVNEDESADLRLAIAQTPGTPLVSLLAKTETALAVSRAVGAAQAHSLVRSGGPLLLWLPGLSVRLAPITEAIATAAGSIGAEHGLRSLDAIHVATAVELRATVSAIVTYDRRMADACGALGLTVASPGTSP